MRLYPRVLVIVVIVAFGLQAQGRIQPQAWDYLHPDLAFWRDDVQIPLSAPDSTAAFENSYRDTFMPPNWVRFSLFAGRIISLTPSQNPREMVVELSDSNDPNDIKTVLRAKLLIDPPLKGTMALGSVIQFKGVIQDFQQNPLQVTFAIDRKDTANLQDWNGN